MATITSKQVIGEVADLVVGVFEANKAGVETAITAGEAGLVTGLTNLLKNLPRPKGIFGSLEAQIEDQIAAQLQTYVQTTIAKYGADAAYAIIDAYMHTLATSVGG